MNETRAPAILQIGSETNIFIVDLLALEKLEKLNKVLKQVVS